MKPPTLKDVQLFCQTHGIHIDCDHFWHHHETRGWVLKGGQKMKSWKSAVRTWQKMAVQFNGKHPDVASEATLEKRRAAQRRKLDADRIVAAGRKKGASDAQIRQVLQQRGLSWDE